jgi:hypothetical protein
VWNDSFGDGSGETFLGGEKGNDGTSMANVHECKGMK